MKSLKKYEQILRNRNYSNRTISIYSCYVQKFIHQHDIKDPYQIRTRQIVDFLQSHHFTSIAQQNQYIGALKLFARYILGKKDIHLDKIERPRAEKRLPRVVDKKILASKLSKIKNIKHRAILSLLYSTGIRSCEVLGLMITDIDSTRMLIRIVQSKGRKDRYVPLSPYMLALLRQYYKGAKPQVYLFNGQSRLQYSYASLKNICTRYLGVTPHLLRHSCATALVESGTNIRAIQELLGHEDIKTTEIYTHVSLDLLKTVILPL